MGWRRFNFICFSQMVRWSVITYWWSVSEIFVLFYSSVLTANVLCSVAQSCPTLWDPKDLSPPGSSVHGIFLARILKLVAISSSRGSSRPRDWTCISGTSSISRWILYNWTAWEPYTHTHTHVHTHTHTRYESRSVMSNSLWPHGL